MLYLLVIQCSICINFIEARTEINPLNLVVKLKGGAKDAQSSRAGTYILGPKTVNEKSYWLQDPGTNAIWYYKGDWNIANHRYLGSHQASIYSSEDVAGPQEATTWQYYNQRKWIISKDIFVEGTKSKISSQRQQITTLTLKFSVHVLKRLFYFSPSSSHMQKNSSSERS